MHNIDYSKAKDLTIYADMLDASVSNESLGVIGEIPAFFADKIKSLTDIFSDADADLKKYNTDEMNIYFKDLYKNRTELYKASGRIDYDLVKRRKVAVTVGLDTDILTMTRKLIEADNLITKHSDMLLSETSTMVAKFVSSKDFRLSRRPIVMDKEYIEANKKLASIRDEILNPKAITDTRRIHVLAPTLIHARDSIENALTYSGHSDTKHYQRLNKRVNEISNYSKELYEVIATDKASMTKQRISDLSKYLQTTAEFVSHDVAMLHLRNQSVIILNNIVTTILAKGK